MFELSEIQAAFEAKFPEKVQSSVFRDNERLQVSADVVFDVLSSLKTDYGFNQLIDVTAVDYLEYPDAEHRFGVVYLLLSLTTGQRLIVKTFVDVPNLVLPSVFSLWNGANWMEREVYDMFGIVFEGHPDLRRILLPDEFTSFPLRKDYPLQGRGERHNFPVIIRSES